MYDSLAVWIGAEADQDIPLKSTLVFKPIKLLEDGFVKEK
jgi:hypothetical protein